MGFKTEQFVEKVDENLKCSICLEVLEDPRQCKDGHTFCKDCITRCLEHKQICPVGNNALQLDSLARSLLAKNMVNNLKVYCQPPESDGQPVAKIDAEAYELKCVWTGELQSLAKHRETCPFQQVQCPNANCNTNMQRRKLEDHDTICEYKELECDEQCGVTLIRRDLANHKTNDCPEVRLSCPNGCRGCIKRKNITTHRETCPFQQVHCPIVNCNTTMQRRELEEHDKICEYKELECDEHCGVTLIRRDLPNHKRNDCPEVKLSCPNACGTTIKRKNITTHRETCPFQQVHCPNVNCNTNMQRRELADHDNICKYKELECDEQCGATLIRRDLPNHKRCDCPEVRLSCPNSCGERIKRKNINTHRETCPFQQVQCPNVNCHTTMQRRELEDHDRICEYKVVNCEKCTQVLVRHELQRHKKIDCPEEMVPCPNSCRSLETGQINEIKRINLDNHMRNDCAKTILDCPFKDQGCSAQVERQHVDKHVQDNMAAHMMLLAKQCSLLTKQNLSLTEQNTIVTEECSAFTKKCSTLTEECSALKKRCSTLTEQCSVLTNKCLSLTEQCSTLKQNYSSLTEENRLLKDEFKKNDERSRTYIWKIRNYRDYYPEGCSRRHSSDADPIIKLRSPIFCLFCYNWFLLLYPNGVNEDKRGFVSVYLCRDSDNCCSRESSVVAYKDYFIQEIPTPSSNISVTCRLSVMSQTTGFQDVSSEKSNVLFDSRYECCVIEWPKFMRSDDAVSEAYCGQQDTVTSKYTCDTRNTCSLTVQCTIQLDKPQ